MKAGYRCELCGADRMFEIGAREDNEAIENYVKYVARICQDDHSLEFPRCHARQLDIKLPITQRGIGIEGDPLSEAELKDVKKLIEDSKKGASR